MSLVNLFRPASNLGWTPDADSVAAAAQGTLLRADNLTLDEKGALALRKGSAKLYTGLADLSTPASTYVSTVKSLAITGFNAPTTENTYRFIGVGNLLYRDGMTTGVTFDGSGDYATGTDSYQAFIARGKTKKKWDGATLNNWAIAAPVPAPTVQAVTAVSASIATYASGESPAQVTNEGTNQGFVTGSDGTSNGATSLLPNASGRISISKVFGSDQDFFNISGNTGNDTDLFDTFIWMSEPTRIQKVTVMFGLNVTTDPFLTDYYAFEFDITSGITNQVKDPAAYAKQAYSAYTTQMNAASTPQQITKLRTPDQVQAVLNQLGSAKIGPVSRERRDGQQASPAWAHLSVTRGQFHRVGGTSGRGWNTIRGFKVVVEMVPGYADTVYLNNAVFFGGGENALTGTYRVGYRYARDTGTYQELSPMSPLSADITLQQQGLQVTVPAAAIAGADPQVNQIWIYVGPSSSGTGGFLDNFYRFAFTGSNPNTSSLTIDEFKNFATGSITATDRTRLVNQGLSIPGATSNPDLILTIQMSEVTALTINESLEPNAVPPPDNIVAIDGPWTSRMFALTSDGYLWISGQRRPSTFSNQWVLDLRQWGNPQWMVHTVGGVYVGMSDDVILIAGTGAESPDHLQIDFTPIPQRVPNPPVDSCVFTDQNTIIFRAADGLMSLVGSTLLPLSKAGTNLLWRGQARHSVNPLNTATGRFRIAVYRFQLFMLAPEGTATTSTPIIWRYLAETNTWYRTQYPVNFASITREPNGNIVAGDDSGNLWQLETGVQDAGANIPIRLVTPIDDGGVPLNRKDAFDLQIHGTTGGIPATVGVYLDGASTPAQTYMAVTGASPDVFRTDATGLGVFLRAQLQITGSFNQFVLNGYNLSYRKRPQQVMSVDTGAVLPGIGAVSMTAEPHRWSWIRQVEVDCISPVNLTLTVFIDDVQRYQTTVNVVPGKRGLYRLTMPRGLGGARPRFLLQSTNPANFGPVGFEPYAIRVRSFISGNESDKNFMPVWPTGESSLS